MAKWNAADEDLSRQCETLFQSGGPRVYVKDGWKLSPSYLSATKAVELSFPGEVVFARRKDGQQYVWKFANGG